MESKAEKTNNSSGNKEKEQAKDTSEKEKKPKTQTHDEKIAELTETLQRLQADFDNYRKRAEQDKLKYLKIGAREIIVQILPVLDSFEIALKNNEADKEKFIKGVEMIFAQLYSTLECCGLRPIECLGRKFDPYRHEVLMKQESDKEDDMIIDEFQKGYLLNEEVVRHSKVKVSKKKNTQSNNKK